MSIIFRELSWPDEITAIYPLIAQLNEGISRERFEVLLGHMHPLGYRCVAAMEGDAIVGIGGFWSRVQFWNDESLQVDNLIVDPARRGERIGERLMEWIEAKARQEGRKMLVLDSYVYNHPSHRFYFRQGYVIRGYHFTKDLA